MVTVEAVKDWGVVAMDWEVVATDSEEAEKEAV